MVGEIGPPGNLVECQEVDIWIWSVHADLQLKGDVRSSLGVESQRPTSTAAAPPGWFGTESAPMPPSPTFFVNVVILKHLLSRVGKRCHSKGFSTRRFFAAIFAEHTDSTGVAPITHSGRCAGSSSCVNVVILKQLALCLTLRLQEYHSRPFTLRPNHLGF